MNHRVLSASIVVACTFVPLAPLPADEVPAQPINLIINKIPRGQSLPPDPDPVLIGEFGNYMAFTAKTSATTRKIFYKWIMRKDRDGIDKFLRPETIGTKKYPIKAGKVVKGEIDNYVYEENPTSTTTGVAFFHEKGLGIYRAQANSKSGSVILLKKTDTDKTGQDPEKMASGLSILDSAGKFPPGSGTFSKYYYFPYLLFAAPDKKKGKELWLSDGTAAGTKVLMDINPGTHQEPGPRGKMITVPDGSQISPISSYFFDLAESYGGQAYFSAFNGNGYDVYRVDAIPDAAPRQPRVVVNTIFRRLFDFDLLVQPTQLSATAGGIFFRLPTTGSGGVEELWGYDPGTDEPGTEDLQVFGVAPNGNLPAGSLQPTNGAVRPGFKYADQLGYLFSGSEALTGREPKIAEFDIGQAQLSSLGDINVLGSSNPRLFTYAANMIFFVADPGMGNGEHLYRSNGNPSGFEDLGAFANVRDITPVVDYFSNGSTTGEDVYFVADDGANGPVLWRVDQFPGGGVPEKVLTAANHPIKNPRHLRKLIANGAWYLFFVTNGAGTEYETITPAKGSPFPAQSQVWYTGEYFPND